MKYFAWDAFVHHTELTSLYLCSGLSFKAALAVLEMYMKKQAPIEQRLSSITE